MPLRRFGYPIFCILLGAWACSSPPALASERGGEASRDSSIGANGSSPSPKPAQGETSDEALAKVRLVRALVVQAQKLELAEACELYQQAADASPDPGVLAATTEAAGSPFARDSLLLPLADARIYAGYCQHTLHHNDARALRDYRRALELSQLFAEAERREGYTQAVEADLAKLPAEVLFVPSPTLGAVLTVGEWVISNPSETVLLLPGEHSLVVAAVGYEPRSATLQVEGGQRIEHALPILLPQLSTCMRWQSTQPSGPASALNRAVCEEAQGDWVAAVDDYQSAIHRSHKLGSSRHQKAYERMATERASALQSKLPTVQFAGASAATAGTTISLDGQVMLDWHRPFIANPGVHQFRVTRAGHEGASGAFTATAGEHTQVTLPAPTPIGSRLFDSTSRTLGVISLGVSGVSAVGGVLLFARIKSKKNESENAGCQPPTPCADRGYSLNRQARRAGNWANGAGVLAVLTGATGLWLAFPEWFGKRDRASSTTTAWRLQPVIGAATAGGLLEGRF